jgi:CBS domain-containing protein
MNAKAILDRKGNEVVTIGPDATMKEAMAAHIENKVGALVVTEPNGTVVGIITERDIFRLAHARSCKIMDIKVGDVMTKEVIIALPDDDLEYLKSLITENRIRHLPAMEQGQLCGLISIGDVVRQQSEEAHVEAHLLRDYIQGTYPK